MKIIFYFFVFTLCFNSLAQQGNFNPEEFDRYVQQAVKDWDVPGLAVAVVNRDSILFINGYGVRELGKREPVDTGTFFAAASTTKGFTAAAVGILVDDGKLNWDDPVVKHLPEFKLKDPYLTQMVTVRDLLTHRTGVPSTPYLGLDPATSIEEILQRLELVEGAYPLRSGFHYQNIMYAVAGEVIKALSGKPWDEFIEKRLLEPLQMNGTFTSLAKSRVAENVARPHDYKGKDLVVIKSTNTDVTGPAGSMWINADDMSRWLKFLLRGCVTDTGNQLLEKSTCEELFKPQTILPESVYPTAMIVKPHWNTYGLGWFQQDYEGRKVDFHTGSLPGMIALVGVIHDENIAVAVFGNRDHAEIRHALMYRVFDYFDRDPPRDWSRDFKKLYGDLDEQGKSAQAKYDSIVVAERVLETKPTVSLDAYAGIYNNPLYGKLEITKEGKELHLKYGLMEGNLEHWHYDTFRFISPPIYFSWRPFVQFDLYTSGKPRTITIDLGGQSPEFTKVEEGKK